MSSGNSEAVSQVADLANPAGRFEWIERPLPDLDDAAAVAKWQSRIAYYAGGHRLHPTRELGLDVERAPGRAPMDLLRATQLAVDALEASDLLSAGEGCPRAIVATQRAGREDGVGVSIVWRLSASSDMDPFTAPTSPEDDNQGAADLSVPADWGLDGAAATLRRLDAMMAGHAQVEWLRVRFTSELSLPELRTGPVPGLNLGRTIPPSRLLAEMDPGFSFSTSDLDDMDGVRAWERTFLPEATWSPLTRGQARS